MKNFLFVVGLLFTCSTNSILRDRNIIRHDQEKLHQLIKELDVETSSQAHKRVHNIRTLLKELDVANIDDARQEIKKLRKNKQKLRILKNKIGGSNFKQAKQRVHGLQSEIFELKQNYQQVQSELASERAHKQQLHDRLKHVNQLLGQ
jgi:hypothetical protein